MLYVLPFPAIDPVLVAIGPFAIRWYALAYVVGILIGWRYARGLAARGESPLTPVLLDDFVTWAVIGIVLGGRLGYILFYDLAQYIEHPLRVFAVWEGGMSFHGGLLGMIIAMALFARRHHLRFFQLTDPVAAATPIGLFLGRLANFINGELYGRPTDVPWAMVFPRDDDHLPRHPSQLYEAGMEGILLFMVLAVMIRLGALKRPGMILGSFILIYGLTRIAGEHFREPDVQLGFLWGGLTMGMLLSIPMLIVGGILVVLAVRRGAPKPLDAIR
jgi:phosphatidylglycerol:prolipoprotein diacylglycerol transferase